MISLVCDIGNSYTKLALFSDDSIKAVFKAADNELLIREITETAVDVCAVSSVVHSKTKKATDTLRNHFGCPVIEITNSSKFNLTIDYETPETLGIDRICSSEGALFLSKKLDPPPVNKNNFLITVDFGTATTINFVKKPASFIGGMIFPGFHLSAEAANKFTFALPKVTNTDYTGLIGKSTRASLANGIMNSTLALIEKTVSGFNCHGESPVLFITGGASHVYLPYIKTEHFYEPDLVLIGLNRILKLNM